MDLRVYQDKVPTLRQKMISMLASEPMDVRALSQALNIPEKSVYEHLPHVARTVQKDGQKLEIQPSRCRTCGFVFKKRHRFTRPGRCPQCKGTHIEGPLYVVR